mgnify:CR=1 FL=1
MADLIKYEMNTVKDDIAIFIQELQLIATKYKLDIIQLDTDSHRLISKYIIFFKYLYLGNTNIKYYKNLISDLYYIILSVLKGEIRYFYLNMRSVIENCIRCISGIALENNHITSYVFDSVKNKFSLGDYSFIKNEYAISCNYIHGGNLLDNSLASVLKTCLPKSLNKRVKSRCYENISKILNLFIKVIVEENIAYVDKCFYKKKYLLGYLIGKDKVDLIFNKR